MNERIEQIREREEKATKGPWRAAESKDGFFVAHGSNPITPEEFFTDYDVEFVAHARADIPFLLKEFDQKEAECAEADKRAGDRWKMYDAERQNHNITKTELAELKESSQRAIKRLQDECDSCNIRTGLEKENAELRERVKELEKTIEEYINVERYHEKQNTDLTRQLTEAKNKIAEFIDTEDQGDQDTWRKRAEKAEAQLEERDKEIDRQEIAINELIGNRDKFEDAISEVAAILGCKDEWSNCHDHSVCIIELSEELISQLEEARKALESITQRANESGIGEMGLIDTIHAMHGIAKAAIKQEK